MPVRRHGRHRPPTATRPWARSGAVAGGGDLLDNLDGVLSSTFDGHRHRVVVDAATDVRHVLAAADRDVAVQHLSYSTPSLSELFKEVVA